MSTAYLGIDEASNLSEPIKSDSEKFQTLHPESIAPMTSAHLIGISVNNTDKICHFMTVSPDGIITYAYHTGPHIAILMLMSMFCSKIKSDIKYRCNMEDPNYTHLKDLLEVTKMFKMETLSTSVVEFVFHSD